MWSLLLAGFDSEEWGFAAFLVTFCAAVYAPLKVRDAGKWRRAMLEEIADPVVETFATEEDHFETHRGSGRLVRRSGKAVYGLHRVQPRSVAHVPSGPVAPTMPRKMVFVGAAGMHALATRPLSADERDELRGVVDELSLRRVWFSVLLSVYAWAAAVAGVLDPGPTGRVRTVIMGSLALWMTFQLFRRGRMWRRFGSDLEGGEVWAVPPPPNGPLSGAGSIEVLPNARAIWSIDGAAAGWRKV